MRLKVEGIHECAELLVAALMDGRDAHVFGRRTLPEMDLASLACAIQNLWLAARAEGKSLRVDVVAPKNLPDRVKGDALRLRTALENLRGHGPAPLA